MNTSGSPTTTSSFQMCMDLRVKVARYETALAGATADLQDETAARIKAAVGQARALEHEVNSMYAVVKRVSQQRDNMHRERDAAYAAALEAGAAMTAEVPSDALSGTSTTRAGRLLPLCSNCSEVIVRRRGMYVTAMSLLRCDWEWWGCGPNAISHQCRLREGHEGTHVCEWCYGSAPAEEVPA
jgi:hypothetical protein